MSCWRVRCWWPPLKVGCGLFVFVLFLPFCAAHACPSLFPRSFSMPSLTPGSVAELGSPHVADSRFACSCQTPPRRRLAGGAGAAALCRHRPALLRPPARLGVCRRPERRHPRRALHCWRCEGLVCRVTCNDCQVTLFGDVLGWVVWLRTRGRQTGQSAHSRLRPRAGKATASICPLALPQTPASRPPPPTSGPLPTGCVPLLTARRCPPHYCGPWRSLCWRQVRTAWGGGCFRLPLGTQLRQSQQYICPRQLTH